MNFEVLFIVDPAITEIVTSWYQSQAMDSKEEQKKSSEQQNSPSLETIELGQNAILNTLKDLCGHFKTISDHLLEKSVQENAETSSNPRYTRDVRSNGRKEFQQFSSFDYQKPRVKLDFPRFVIGEDPTIYICKAEQWFLHHEVPVSERVQLAGFHLEGDAQLWFQLLKQEMIYISWEEYKDNMYARFGDNQYMDFFGELSKLSQTSTTGGTVQEFREKFEKLLAKAGPIPQHQQVSMFISGLDVSIRTDVQANKPTTLSSTIGLARLFEARNVSNKLVTTSVSKTDVQPLNTPVSSSLAPVRKMSIDEINERKSKGLCFKCNEKFVPGHRCKRLFAIQANLEDSDDDIETKVEEICDKKNEVPEISLHAITGSRTPETMQVTGKLGLKSVDVLIDSGSTHNFVCERTAEKIGLQPISKGKLQVMVATGEKVSCSGICPKAQLMLQGIPIFVDVYLLPLEGYDVILGTQWLRTLGPIVWDFSKFKMNFKIDGKEVSLQGLSTSEKRVDGSRHRLQIPTKNKGILLHLCSLEASQPPKCQSTETVETSGRGLEEIVPDVKLDYLSKPSLVPDISLEDKGSF